MDTQSQYCESINLPDMLSIRHVLELHSKLSAEFRSKDEIVVSISDGAEADLSFIQLVEAARRQAKSEGKTFRLSSPASGSVLKVLERGGFIESFDQEDLNFWLHKEVML
ncbi:STAS domain-containing protein [Rhizobium bangladeshense]|uniref:STAS domain-containing protein n=1 Tax=Rhizobium bangladeshense TaxID=1138189 RepID=UPI0007E58E38|nr:STAS domain-containing protein [Rhizobium bangladeshense]